LTQFRRICPRHCDEEQSRKSDEENVIVEEPRARLVDDAGAGEQVSRQDDGEDRENEVDQVMSGSVDDESWLHVDAYIK
jgi:hypothetical protein